MFDPMQSHFCIHQPIENHNNLDEEQVAQRYGSTIKIPSLLGKLTLLLGRLLIKMGERLTAEHSTVELSQENT
jgi:hypothetical protein